jgi:Ca-activated chloride channel family protein
VESYRLVGYENRVLANEDYLDDTKDAGELGAGHTVTVCYELILKGDVAKDSGICELGVRYMKPDSDKSEEQVFAVSGEYITDTPDDEFEFMCAVIETSMILHKSKYIGDMKLGGVLETLRSLELSDDEYKREFVSLIEKLNG